MTKMTQEQQKSQLTHNALHAELDQSDAFVVVDFAAFLVFVVEFAAFEEFFVFAAFTALAAFAVNEDHISDGINNGWVKVSGKKRKEIRRATPDCYTKSPSGS